MSSSMLSVTSVGKGLGHVYGCEVGSHLECFLSQTVESETETVTVYRFLWPSQEPFRYLLVPSILVLTYVVLDVWEGGGPWNAGDGTMLHEPKENCRYCRKFQDVLYELQLDEP